jgi:hypothetical protein
VATPDDAGRRTDLSMTSRALRSGLACWALVLLSMVRVGWIRLLPLSLGIVDDRAEGAFFIARALDV